MDKSDDASALKELGPGYIEAGAEFFESIRTLGLDPDGLFWAFDRVVNGHVLALVTRMFDHAGPLALSQTIFKAYNASALPKSITPFVVRMHSPRHEVILGLKPFLTKQFKLDWVKFNKDNADKFRIKIDEKYENSSFAFRPEWIYKFDLSQERRKTMPVGRRWERYARNVDRLAA